MVSADLAGSGRRITTSRGTPPGNGCPRCASGGALPSDRALRGRHDSEEVRPTTG